MFRLEIETSNAAFEGSAAEFEIARILRQLADTAESGLLAEGTVRDVNGNKVGSWQYTPEGE